MPKITMASFLYGKKCYLGNRKLDHLFCLYNKKDESNQVFDDTSVGNRKLDHLFCLYNKKDESNQVFDDTSVVNALLTNKQSTCSFTLNKPHSIKKQNIFPLNK